MKSAKFRADGVGAVVGLLASPTELRYENEGHVLMFSLIGNVIETERNDVVVLGQKTDDSTMSVCYMESLPKQEGEIIRHTLDVNGQICELLAIPAQLVKETKKVVIGDQVKDELSIELGKNHVMHLVLYQDFESTSASGCYVFLLPKQPKVVESEHGEGYAKRKIKAEYTQGVQLLS